MTAFSLRRFNLPQLQQTHSVSLSIGLAVIVYLADLFTPLGVASGVPYSLAVILALNTNSRKYVIGFAILCSLLTVSDIFLGPGPGGSEMWKVLTNRFLALFMIWTTTSLGLLRWQAELRRREAEDQTRLHLADLAHMERVNTAGQLATSLAHELNQPLAAISLQSDIANQVAKKLSNQELTTLLSDALTEIADQSQRASSIIQGLRDLVSKSEPKYSDVELNDLVSEVTRLLDVQVQYADINLQINLSNSPQVLGDRIQLEQVLLNLLQNSIDSISESGSEKRNIKVETTTNNNSVQVCVHDTGLGLAAQDTEHVFERFYSSKAKGMGMGLALSRSIIEAHGGKLWAVSQPTSGATFCFKLPCPH